MSHFIKLRRVVGHESGHTMARFNVDEIYFYYAELMTQTGKEIMTTRICMNDYSIHVLETPDEVDNIISSPVTNKLAKWSEE